MLQRAGPVPSRQSSTSRWAIRSSLGRITTYNSNPPLQSASTRACHTNKSKNRKIKKSYSYFDPENDFACASSFSLFDTTTPRTKGQNRTRPQRRRRHDERHPPPRAARARQQRQQPRCRQRAGSCGSRFHRDDCAGAPADAQRPHSPRIPRHDGGIRADYSGRGHRLLPLAGGNANERRAAETAASPRDPEVHRRHRRGRLPVQSHPPELFERRRRPRNRCSWRWRGGSGCRRRRRVEAYCETWIRRRRRQRWYRRSHRAYHGGSGIRRRRVWC